MTKRFGIDDLNFTRVTIPTYVAPVVKSDTVELPYYGSLYIGTAGDVVVESLDGGIATFKNLPNSSWIPGVFKKVFAATSATDIVLLSFNSQKDIV